MNQFILLGKLVKDPELLYGKTTNKPYCKFTVGVESWSGEKKFYYFDLVAFDKKAEAIAKYFEKGQNILVSGQLQQNVFEGKDGVKHSEIRLQVNDFEFTESKKSRSETEGEKTEKKAVKKDDGNEFMTIPANAEFSLPFK